jgi:hypothetical protein
MRRNGLAIAGLVVLLVAIDQLYRLLHPDVDFVRASLVGASAYLALLALRALGLRWPPPARGAFAIAASAFVSVALIEAGCLVSRSPTSAAVHALIVAAAFLAFPARTRAGALAGGAAAGG